MFLKFLCFAGLISSCLGHGRLKMPPSRSSMWRYGYDNPPNYTDHELSCGGYGHQHDVNGGMCGECGDPWDIPVGQRPNQAGGLYANGIITEAYDSGQTIEIEVEITANHLGYFEFRLCVQNDPSTAITHACLDQNVLELADGSGTRWYLPDSSYGSKFVDVRLPAGVTCSQCVLQWKYNTGNRWDCDEEGCGNGHGPQEQFYGCSDIEIIGSGGGTTTSTEATTTTTQASTTTTSDSPPEETSSSSPPTSTPTFLPPGDLICKAAGPWEGNEDMDQWCQENCNHQPPNCSDEVCKCEEE